MIWHFRLHCQRTMIFNFSFFRHICSWRWRRQWHPTPVLLPGKFHGRRSLVGCSPWGRKESDMAERLHFHFSLSCIGEGNGNPLQCSWLENPRDGGAWWAAVYGVTQTRTWLKWLSSSSIGILYIINHICNVGHWQRNISSFYSKLCGVYTSVSADFMFQTSHIQRVSQLVCLGFTVAF